MKILSCASYYTIYRLRCKQSHALCAAVNISSPEEINKKYSWLDTIRWIVYAVDSTVI